MELTLTTGKGRTRISLEASDIGQDLVIRIFNAAAHIGAVAIGEYDLQSTRVSVSLITRLGHKDDVIARKAADAICRHTHRPVCVIAGVHLDNITVEEINRLVDNSSQIVQDFLTQIGQGG